MYTEAIFFCITMKWTCVVCFWAVLEVFVSILFASGRNSFLAEETASRLFVGTQIPVAFMNFFNHAIIETSYSLMHPDKSRGNVLFFHVLKNLTLVTCWSDKLHLYCAIIDIKQATILSTAWYFGICNRHLNLVHYHCCNFLKYHQSISYTMLILPLGYLT